MLKTDNNGLAINDKQTYDYIVSVLKDNKNIVVSWTDGRSVQFDILFVLQPAHDPNQMGKLQGGINHSYLFVAIMRLGSFAFATGKASGQNYYTEKLSVPFDVGYELAELINGIRTRL